MNAWWKSGLLIRPLSSSYISGLMISLYDLRALILTCHVLRPQNVLNNKVAFVFVTKSLRYKVQIWSFVRHLLGADIVKRRLQSINLSMDGWFTGADFPHYALQQLAASINRRWLAFLFLTVLDAFCLLWIVKHSLHIPSKKGTEWNYAAALGGHVTSPCTLAGYPSQHCLSSLLQLVPITFPFLLIKSCTNNSQVLGK